MSDAEAALVWQCKAARLPEPVTEHRFHPDRRWRFDVAWPAHKVAVEIEGGIWTQGRHTRGLGYEMDLIKYDEAALLSWLVLRVTPAMVDDGRALSLVERAIALQEV